MCNGQGVRACDPRRDAPTEQLYHFRGCGAAFPWAVGYAQFLRDRCALEPGTQFSGLSAGALVAAVLALDLDLNKAVRLAIELQHRLVARVSGLFGIWRDLLVDYYQQMIPVDAPIAGMARLHIGLTRVAGRMRYVSRFHGRTDLIDALLATQHLPFFVDLKPWAHYRGHRYLDAFWRAASPPAGFARYHVVALPRPWEPGRGSIRPWEVLTPKTLARAQYLHRHGYNAAAQALAVAPAPDTEVP